MASIRDVNFAYQDPAGKVCDGDTVESGNFCQAIPGTSILTGVKTLTILGGNWVNVRRQPTWVVKGGNWAQIEWCTNLHPELITFGVKACSKDCNHVVPGADAKIPSAETLVAEVKAKVDQGRYADAKESLERLEVPERGRLSRYADKVL